MRLRRKDRPVSPAVEAAKAEHRRSDRLRNEAAVLVRDLHKIRERNHIRERDHFAQALREMIEGT